MVPEIWSVTDKIFIILDHFFPFYHPWRYYHFTNVYHKWQSYNVWFLRYGVQRTDFFVILDCFLPFYSSSNPKSQNFEKKWKKTPGDIIILHRCSINDNHMMYGSRHIKHDRHFLTFYPPNNPKKSKFWENEKQHLEILSFCTCVPQMTIIWCIVPDISSLTDRTFCHFGPFFILLPH